MAAAPRRDDAFDDAASRVEVLRVRLLDARAEADRYEADPTSQEAMERAFDILEILARQLEAEDIHLGVGDDGTIDITWYTAKHEVYLEIGPETQRTQSIETDLLGRKHKEFGDHLALDDIEVLVNRASPGTARARSVGQ